MRRKRRSDTGAGEMTEVLVSCGFPRVCGIWFTVAFRETITIAAIGTPRRCVTPPLARSKDGSGLRGTARERRTLSGTRKMACRAMRRRWSDQQCGEFGQQRRAASAAARGTRASANTSGPDFTRSSKPIGALGPPVKLRIMRSAPNEENLFLLPDRFFERANSLEITIQPFDLMSRRHPLSSTRAPGRNPLLRSSSFRGLV